jgi:hypothetical protein
VYATKSAIADIISANALIVAEIGGNGGMCAARGDIALINSARVTIVAITGNILPFASLSGNVASISGAGVTIVTLSVRCALTGTNAQGLRAAESSSSLARISEASRVRLAGDRGGEAGSLCLVASVLLAEVVGVVAVARSRLAANTANVRGAAERGRVASIRGSALTADTESAATTTGVNVLLASTSDEVKRVLGKIGEVSVSDHTLRLLIGDN